MKMKKHIISSYLSFSLLLIIIALEVLLTNKHISIEGLNMRKTYVFISYFIHLPLFLFNLILALKVFIFYFNNKFQNPPKYFYLVLPSVVFYVVCLFYLLFGLIKLVIEN
jgi:hypothetical protein